jgi:hypothetical protein
MRKDQRPPVIYLRSFADELGEYSGKRFFGNWFARDMLGIPPSEEQRIFAEHMQLIGPYIAIGRPSEPFPELGAARKYVSDDEWRQVVGELIDRAAAVVVQAGRTSGLAWEIGQLIVRAPPRKVLLILSRWQSEYDAFRAWADRILPQPLPAAMSETRLVAFRANWECYPLEARSGLLWTLKPFFNQNGFPFPTDKVHL